MTAEAFHQKLKLSGALIAAGLVLEVATLYWSHPITFIAFILGGGTLVGAGVLLYLYSLVTR